MNESLPTRTLRELSRIFFARFPAVLAIVVIITGATLAACLVAPRAYRSSVTFLVREPGARNPSAQQVSSDRSLQVFVKTQYELITSETVLARSLVLGRDAAGGIRAPWAAARRTLDAVECTATRPSELERAQAHAAWRAAMVALDQEVERQLADPAQGPALRDEVRKLARRLKVQTAGYSDEIALSETFTVQVTQPGEPEDARRAADLLSASYIDRYREVQAGSGSRSVDFLQNRVDGFRKDQLGRAETNLREFVEKVLESPADVGILEQLSRSGTEAGRQIVVRRFQEELITLDGELAESAQLKQQLLEQLPDRLWEGREPGAINARSVPAVESLAEATLPDSDPVLTSAVIIIPEATLKNNVVVSQLKAKEVDLIIEVNRLKVEYLDDSRTVRDKLAEIARTRRQILRELIGEVAALDIKSSVLAARQKEIRQKMEVELARLNRITGQLVRYQELQNEVNVAREEYRRMSADLASAERFAGQEADAITLTVIDPARMPDPDRPAYPNTPLYTALAAIVGVLLAGAYACLADHFDHSLRSTEQAERYLGVPVVGSIGQQRRGLLV